MIQHVNALRAISAVFMRRLLRKFLLIGGLIVLAVVLLFVYLMTEVDRWWSLGFVIVGPAVLVLGLFTAFLWWLTGKLIPRRLNRNESRKVIAFMDKLFDIAEQARTPLPILGVQIASDLILRRGSNRLGGMIQDTTSLRSEYAEIQKIVG